MRFIGLIAAVALAAMPTPAPAKPVAFHQGGAWAAAATLHRGVNILGYDPLWKDPAKARFQPRHFKIIRDGGFDFVRLVLQSFSHMDATNRLDPKWVATLDRMVDAATAAGLSVIIDEHDFNICSEDPQACADKLGAFWRQMAPHLRNRPKSVLFELLNEPHGKLDGANWNILLSGLIPLVRETNPGRTLVIGPTHWNNLDDLPLLKLPKADRNILVTFHSYEPFKFTHQGAPWVDDMKTVSGVRFTAADERTMQDAYDKVAAWSRAQDRPILMGEFGAYEKSGTPMADRVLYTATVRRQAESHGFPWAYWQFDSDFIVYDIEKDRWIEPIRGALIPKS